MTTLIEETQLAIFTASLLLAGLGVPLLSVFVGLYLLTRDDRYLSVMVRLILVVIWFFAVGFVALLLVWNKLEAWYLLSPILLLAGIVVLVPFIWRASGIVFRIEHRAGPKTVEVEDRRR